MVHTIPDILARIVERKRHALAGIRAHREELERTAATRTEFRDFRAALSAAPAVISEIKKASPARESSPKTSTPPPLPQPTHPEAQPP